MLSMDALKRIQDAKPTFTFDFINHANDEFLKARDGKPVMKPREEKEDVNQAGERKFLDS